MSGPSSNIAPPSDTSPLTPEASEFQLDITVKVKIDTATGGYVISQEQRPNNDTGLPQTISFNGLPSENSGQPQTHDSPSAGGVEKSSKAQCEEPEQRVKEWESESETLLLRVKGRRGMERSIVERDKLWFDKVQEEVEAKIREVEWRANQNTTTVIMSSTSSNSRGNGGVIQLTPPSKNLMNPEVGRERIYPIPPRPPSRHQGESARQRHPPFWSPPLHDSTYNTPSPVPPADHSPQASRVPPPPWREGSYPVSGPSFPYRSGSTEPSNAQRHQAQLYVPLSGLTPYAYVEPIGQSPHPLSTTIDVHNSEQFPYPHENAVYNPQQGSPQILWAGPYPYTDGNPFPQYRSQSPQYFDTLDYTREYNCRPLATPVYDGESNDLRQSFWPRVQQPLADDSEDGYFPGGFHPCLC